MFPKVNPSNTKAWKELQQHAAEMNQKHLKDIFIQDPDRFRKFSFCFNDTVIDFSKNLVTEETIRLLFQLAGECKLREAIEAMFEGDFINQTENRSVLHIALRNFSGKPVYSAGKNIMEEVLAVQTQMKVFCGKVHCGEWKGYTGKKIKYIVNIGIGGS